jgi:hypothetical protein
VASAASTPASTAASARMRTRIDPREAPGTREVYG